jgi:hypothetical protein
MITDVPCHFVPDEFFRFASTREEFAIKVKRREGDAVDLDIRGMQFGLNTTFFDMPKQLERMKRDGVERSILSLATPFVDYHLDAKVAVEAARVFNDALRRIASDKTGFGGWALLPCRIRLRRRKSFGVVFGIMALSAAYRIERWGFICTTRSSSRSSRPRSISVYRCSSIGGPPRKDRTRNITHDRGGLSVR